MIFLPLIFIFLYDFIQITNYYVEQVKEAFAREKIPVGVTALSDTARDIRQWNLRDMAVVIGSEGQGVRPKILEQADARLIIPMDSRCESLNAAVAATIVLWQMTNL